MSKTKSYITEYCLFGFALIILLAAVIVLNNTHERPNIDKITDAIEIDNGDLKINWNRFNKYEIELSENLNISSSGVYHLTGSLVDQNITINVPDGKVKLILDSVTIKNNTGPAIICRAADDLVVELVGENTLEDGPSYAANYDKDVNGVIYSKDDLTLQGDGMLNLISHYQDGIVGKDDLKINSGNYNINAVDDGIRGKDSVYIEDGNFNIIARSDAIKSTNETRFGKGFVFIKKGEFHISSGAKGIRASKNLIIEDGIIDIRQSYEGLEAQSIVINGGNISITSSDDGVNASSSLNYSDTDTDAKCVFTINGGNLYINASGDGIDSNGYIYFNDGMVTIDGPTSSNNGSLDSGTDIIMNGGTVIAVGAAGMAKTLGSSSSIHSVSVYFASNQPSGTKITIRNSNDDIVAEHISKKSFSHMSVGTPDFQPDETYTIYINDKQYAKFTISEIITML